MEKGSTPYQRHIRSWWFSNNQSHNGICTDRISTSQSPETKKSILPAQFSPVHLRTYCSNYKCLHKLFNAFIPTVYAKEKKATTEDSDKESQSEMTVLEKLSKKKPDIVVSDKEVHDYLSNETGKDRLKAMFTRVDDKISDEILFIGNTAFGCAVLSFMLWSVRGMKHGREQFIRQHQHTKFLTKFRASRRYNDAVFYTALKWGFKWGFKTYIFVGFFLLTETSISVYRNKSSISEYLFAGVATGSFLRLNLGLRGIVRGGLLGGVLGLTTGSVLYGLMWMYNQTQEERHYFKIEEMLRKNHEVRLLNPTERAQEELKAQG